MEYRLPQINRIADIAWIPQKIVFEIQCASITAEEVMGRNASYASIGYDVVWILHTNRYNKARVTSAEDILQSHAHYYTDINTQGKGSIFDHFAVIEGGRRVWRFPTHSIEVTRPYSCHEKKVLLKNDIPKRFSGRYHSWTRGFDNDYLDVLLKKETVLTDLFQRLHLESGRHNEDGSLMNQLIQYTKKWIVYPYQVVFRHILEKASR